MELRPYQSRSIAEVHEKWNQGSRSVCLVSPTGSGKTILGIELAQEKKTLWICHRLELLDQTRARVPSNIQVSTVQGLLASGRRPECEVFILDEMHHYLAEEWRKLVESYPNTKTVGMTASPMRRDGQGLGDICDSLVVAAHYSELISGGWLIKPRCFRPKEEIRGLAVRPEDAWNRFAKNKRGFAYFSRTEFAEKFSTAMGECCATVFGTTPKDDRIEIMNRFRRGDIQILSNCDCLSEGVDVPEAEVALIARGCDHISTWIQIIGRVMRPAPNKTGAAVIDLPGVSHRHGLPGTDLIYSLTGRPIRATIESLTICQMCGCTYPCSDGVCPSCGYSAPPKVARLRVWNMSIEEAIEKAQTPKDRAIARYRQRMSNLGIDDLRALWNKLKAEGDARGYRRGWAMHRYRLQTGNWPSKQVMQ